MPANVASGSVVELACGRTYHGTLDLQGKSNVRVRTAGSCGKAVLSPGEAIGGWVRHEGDVYSAAVSFPVAQVIVDGNPVAAAHWPNRPQTWARASGATAASLAYAMPNADLTGALLVYKAHEWSIDARRITGYANGTMSLESTGNRAYDGYPPGANAEFYVEGKLWMLDEPGEWAVSGGRLYVWAPDGRSPEGRIWASPDRNGIEASDSRDVTIEGVQVFGSANGIHAVGAVNLRLSNSGIAHSSENGIVNAGGQGLAVEGASIRHTRHDAIVVRWGGGGEVIRNSAIDASGVIGMPTNAHAAIYLAHGSGATIENNSITNSGFVGIRSFRDATVARNTVDGACLVLGDCGGLYTSAPDGQPLNARIEGNTVLNVGTAQRLAWGIYLDDRANGVTLAGNNLAGNRNGVMMINSFNNTVTGNTFSRSGQAHLEMAETGSAPTVRENSVSGNTFIARNGEEIYRVSSDFGTSSVTRFSTYSDNSYASSSAYFANFNGEAVSFSQWKTRTGQDGTSTFRVP